LTQIAAALRCRKVAVQHQRGYEGLSIHATIFLGFGLILGLWLFAWYEMGLRIKEAQQRATAINARYTSAQDALATVRTQALTGSVVLRDALLDPDSRKVAQYRSQLEQIYKGIDATLDGYVQVSESPAERGEFALLRQELDAFRDTMLEVLATDSSHWRDEARQLLSLRVTPKRDIVISVSERVQALNRVAYIDRQRELADVYGAVQRELWQLLGLALAIGVGVAVIAVLYAGRLERRIRRQMTKDLELTSDLQRLSEKLVTAQEHERRQIARELHDEIGQALTAIKVELACVQNAIDSGHVSASLLHDARSITDSALHQVRDLSYLLHPAALDELGLFAATNSYLQRFGKRHGVAARLIQNGMTPRLSHDVELAAYRIIQEALTNVARHSGATSCRVLLSYASGHLRICIEDNGSGFDVSRRPSESGLGLIGIRERSSHFHGTALVESEPGQGTRLIVDLPAAAQTIPDFESIPDPTVA
jgi:signal transduction histidine kinase